MQRTLEIASKAPEFSLLGTDGLIHTLREYHSHRAVLLFFVTNTSYYALATNSHVIELYNEYYTKGIAFIAINAQKGESLKEMDAMKKRENLPWDYLYDRTANVISNYGVTTTPHYMVLNHNRNLVYSGRALENPLYPERSTSFELKDALEDIVASRPVRTPLKDPIGTLIEQEVAETALV